LASATPAATVTVAPAVAPDLSAVEQRLLARMRAELATQSLPARRAEVTPVHLIEDVNKRLTDSEQRSLQLILDFYGEFANSTRSRDSEIREIKSKVAQFETVLETMGGR
jgi:hypothetical protein